VRRYGQINMSFWQGLESKNVSDAGKLLAAFFLTGPHSNSLGCFRCPIGYIQADLSWDYEKTSSALKELLDIRFIHFDSGRGWILIPNFLKYNRIQNKKVGIFVGRLAESIPPESSVFSGLIKALENYGQYLPDGLVNSLEEKIKKGGDELPQREEPTPATKAADPISPPQAMEKEINPETNGPAPIPSRQVANITPSPNPEIVSEIYKVAAEIEKLRNGKRLNIYAWIKGHEKKHSHPGAMLQSLVSLRDHWNTTEKPWAYLERIISIENGNFHEQDAIRESEELNEGFQSLANILKGGGVVPGARAP